MFFLENNLNLKTGIYQVRPGFTQFMRYKNYLSTEGLMLCNGVVKAPISGHALSWERTTGAAGLLFTDMTGVGPNLRVFRPAGRIRSGRAALITGELVEVLHSDAVHSLVARQHGYELLRRESVIQIADARFCTASESKFKFREGMQLRTAMATYFIESLSNDKATLTILMVKSPGLFEATKIVCGLHRTQHTEILTVPLAHSSFYIAAQDYTSCSSKLMVNVSPE